MNDTHKTTPPLVFGSNDQLGLGPERDYATWYEASHYSAATIKPVRILRETRYQVVLADCSPGNARRMKVNTYFKTWDAAHEHLLHTAQHELDAARRVLQVAQARLGNVKGLRPNASLRRGQQPDGRND